MVNVGGSEPWSVRLLGRVGTARIAGTRRLAPCTVTAEQFGDGLACFVSSRRIVAIRDTGSLGREETSNFALHCAHTSCHTALTSGSGDWLRLISIPETSFLQVSSPA
jgi:hypothetical protein